ncbi:MAG: hypothetical protein ACK5PB_08070 [Pirellula sp.]
MKRKWFSGLAISMGFAAFPGLSEAQYAGNGSGLGASSFQLPPLPAERSAVRPTAYRQGAPATIGSGVPNQVPAEHQDPYTLGQLREYEAVPASPPIQSRMAPPPPPPVAAIQPIQGQPYPQPHAQQHIGPHEHVGPTHQAGPSHAPCPACAAGSCAAHGVGPYHADQSHGAVPVSGVDSCASDYQDCGPAVTGLTTAVSPSPWIFGASGLLFNRIDDYDRRLASSGPTDWLSTGDAAMRASGGFQGSVGRYFDCGRYALVGTYWGIFSEEQMASITPGGGTNIRTDLPFTPIAPGVAPVPPWHGAYMPLTNRPVYDWYDSGSTQGSNNPAAHSQRIVRDNEFHNVEINLFTFALGGGARQGYPCSSPCGRLGFGLGHRHGGHGGYTDEGQCSDDCGDSSCGSVAGCATGLTGPCAPWYGAQCSKLRLNTFGGVRWFRFGDELEYASSQTDNMYGTTDDDFYYNSDVTNDLVGVQLGTLATWCTGRRFNFFGGTSFGIYNNHIRTYTRAGTTMTDAMIRPLGSPATADVPFNFSNSLNDVAFIGEGTLGTGICIKPGWTLNLGYRVLGVAGVATSVGQIPTEFTHVNSIQGIHNDRSLILHGAVFGMDYNF